VHVSSSIGDWPFALFSFRLRASAIDKSEQILDVEPAQVCSENSAKDQPNTYKETLDTGRDMRDPSSDGTYLHEMMHPLDNQ
jgi:hypothetical protein